MTSFSLEVLLVAILKRGAGGITQNMLDYYVT